jgi:uncharacterized delta-60 repeat protein
LLSAGEIDPFFGDGGIVKPQIDLPGITRVLDLEPLANGKLLASASVAHPKPGHPNEFNFTIALIRLNRDGSRDTTFGGGDAVIDTGVNGFQRADLLRQPNGKVLLCSAKELARFNADGSFDSSFGDGGRIMMDAQDAQVALQPDGRIIVGGSRSGWLYAQRFLADGTPDNSFSGDSVATVHGVGGAAGFSGFALMPNGTMYIGGVWTVVPQNDIEIAVQEFVIAHLRNNGTVDTAYGPSGNGLITKRMGVYIGMSGRMVVEPNEEKVLFCVLNDSNHLIYRYDRRGALDVTYGESGQFNARPRTGPDLTVDAQGFLMEHDGAILALGSSHYGSDPNDFVEDPALSRVTPDGKADLEFGKSGIATCHLPGAIPPSNDRYTFAEAATFALDGSILVAAIDRDDTFSLLRFWRDKGPAAEVTVRPIASPTTSLVIDVDYRAAEPIDTRTFDDRDLRITGPDGYVAYAKFDRVASRSSDGRRVRARYKLGCRGGSWDASDYGSYVVRLRNGQISDSVGNFAKARSVASMELSL